MAITAEQVESSNTLEQFRQEFNSLQSDVSGLEAGTIAFTTVQTTNTNTTTINILEDGSLKFEGATDDGFETTLNVVDPTADRTLSLPNESGTLFTSGTTSNALITNQTSISSGDIVSGSDELLISDASASTFKRVTVDNLVSSAGGLTSVAADSSPQLGADLDVNSNDIVSVSNGNISLLPNGSGKVILDGNGSSGGVSITDGNIDIRTGTGSVSKILFYCESSNAHAQTLQAAPHSASSSSVSVLPTASGTLIGTGDTGTLPLAAIDIDGGTDIGEALVDADLLIVDNGAGGTNRKVAMSRIATYVGAAAGGFAIANLDIDGGADIGAALATTDLIIVDDGAGGTNRKATLARLLTLTDGNATALAIALG
jgi:hypothetical protein